MIDQDRQRHIIQPLRFRLSPDALRNRGIAVLNFPWHQPVNEFLKHIKEARGRRRLQYWDYPSWNVFNRAISLSAFVIHPFIKYYDRHKALQIRKAMLVGDIERPDGEKIALLTRTWLRWYALKRFERDLDTPIGKAAYKRLFDGIIWNEHWNEIDAVDLVQPGDIDDLAYQAIPGLIAVLLENRPITYADSTIQWNLVSTKQDTLGLVSQPIPSQNEKGFFAIHLSITVATVPGDPVPYVDIGVHLRRYLETTPTRLGQNDNTVMVKTGEPWIIGWPDKEPVRVPISVRGYTPAYAAYSDALADFLQTAKTRALVSPQQLLHSPKQYWSPDQETGDQYFVLYREGIRPNHALETGYSMDSLRKIYAEILRITDGILTPVPPLHRDLWDYRRAASPIATTSIWSFWDRKVFASSARPGRKTIRMTDDDKRGVLQEALRKSATDKPIRLYILYFSESTKDTLSALAADILGTDDPDISIHPIPMPPALVAPILEENDPSVVKKLTSGGNRKERNRTFNDARSKAWRKRVKDCRTFLNNQGIGRVPGKTTNDIQLAFIELPEQDYILPELNPKSALRKAFVAEHIHSQFIVSIEQPWAEMDKQSSDFYRARSAVADLLIRQTGLGYGDMDDLYRWIQLPESIREELSIIGLYRIRTNRKGNRPKLDYSIAIRVSPNRHTEIRLPDGQWMPYMEGVWQLGDVFRDSTYPGRKFPLQLSLQQTQQFIEQILLDGSTENRILFVMAQDYRIKVWPQLLNTKMTFDLHIPGKDIVYQPRDLPGLRIVRLREKGTLSETPQYVRVDSYGEAEGLYPVGKTERGFSIYFSIGRNKIFDKQHRDEDKTGVGGSVAFKHVRLLEIVPFFLQDGDDPVHLARAAHIVRFPLHWEMGSLSVPWPMHLAKQLANDLMDIFD